MSGRETSSIRDRIPAGLLSRPCARMETKVEGFFLGIYVTLCALVVLSMMAFGPDILEWVEGTPSEPV